jgi:hypothetical protein
LKRLRASLAELQHEVGARPSRGSRPSARISRSPKPRSQREPRRS